MIINNKRKVKCFFALFSFLSNASTYPQNIFKIPCPAKRSYRKIDELTPYLISGRELVVYITNEVMKEAPLTCNPISQNRLSRCFETEIEDIEDKRLRKNLSDTSIQEAVIDLLAKKIVELSIESRSQVPKNRLFDYKAEFAQSLDNSDYIERGASFANKFSIDYLSSRDAIRLYYKDKIYWIIENKRKRI